MDKSSAGVITFEEIASIINSNAFLCEEVTPEKNMVNLVEDLSRYFKGLSNVDFDEKKFKEICLK